MNSETDPTARAGTEIDAPRGNGRNGGLAVRIRPFAEEDYPVVVDLVNRSYPEYGDSEAEWRFGDTSRNPEMKFARFVGEFDDRVVAVANYEQWENMYHPRKFAIDLTVDPDLRRHGIGAQMYAHLWAVMAAHDPLALHAQAREDYADSVRFLERRGFADVMRAWESRLDLQAFDASPYAEHLAAFRASGLRATTLDQLAGEPDRDRKLYDMVDAVARDVPSPDPPYLGRLRWVGGADVQEPRPAAVPVLGGAGWGPICGLVQHVGVAARSPRDVHRADRHAARVPAARDRPGVETDVHRAGARAGLPTDADLERDRQRGYAGDQRSTGFRAPAGVDHVRQGDRDRVTESVLDRRFGCRRRDGPRAAGGRAGRRDDGGRSGRPGGARRSAAMVVAAAVAGVVLAAGDAPRALAQECDEADRHPDWIFCHDFEAPDAGQFDRYWNDIYGAGERMFLIDDNPDGVPGARAMRLQVTNATDRPLAEGVTAGPKKFLGRSVDWAVIHYRRYVRFGPDFHQGNFMHLGGLGASHPTLYPWGCMGGAGLRPRGDQCFSSNLEPWSDYQRLPWPGRWGFYSYYHQMHMDCGHPGPDDCYGDMFAPTDDALVSRGDWHVLEMAIDPGTPGEADGTQTFWIDGQRIHTATGIAWRTTDALRVNQAGVYLYIHNNPARTTNILDVDNVLFSRAYIGPAACADGEAIGAPCRCGGTADAERSDNVHATGYCCAGTWRADPCGGSPTPGPWVAAVHLPFLLRR